MPFLTIIPFVSYLLVALLLTRYFTQESETHQHKTLANVLLLLACVTHAYLLSNLWQSEGVFFGLSSSVSFVAWVVATLLFATSFSKPIHVLGIIVYPLAAIALLLSLTFPDTQNKLIEVSIAAHVFLSISAYALLAIAVCTNTKLTALLTSYHHYKQWKIFCSKL